MAPVQQIGEPSAGEKLQVVVDDQPAEEHRLVVRRGDAFERLQRDVVLADGDVVARALRNPESDGEDEQQRRKG